MIIAIPNPGIIATARPSGPIAAPASQDWALQMLNGPQATLALYEIEMMETNVGANVATGGQGYQRYTTNHAFNTFSADNQLFDGNTSTGRNVVDRQVDLCAFAYHMTTPRIIRRFRVRGHPSSGDSSPFGLLAMVSYDARATWNTVGIFAETSWPSATWKTWDYDPLVWLNGLGRNSARAWRVVVNAWQAGLSQPQIGDLAFAETIGGPTLCTGGAAICSAHAGTQGTLPSPRPDLAFDGDNRTVWGGTGNNITGQRLGYAFQVAVNAGALRMKNLDWTANGSPTNFDVQWSADLQSWTTAVNISGLSWSANETKAWTIP